MDAPVCPVCDGRSTYRLSQVIADESVSYYRCGTCGHIWVIYADGRPAHHVTPLPSR